jgi:hypothetical protein
MISILAVLLAPLAQILAAGALLACISRKLVNEVVSVVHLGNIVQLFGPSMNRLAGIALQATAQAPGMMGFVTMAVATMANH